MKNSKIKTRDGRELEVSPPKLEKYVGYDNDKLERDAAQAYTAPVKELLPEAIESEAKLIEAFVTLDEEIEDAAPCWDIDGVTVGTLGNFSLVIGKAKSRKTFLLSLVTGSILKGENEIIKGHTQGKILYFDTEQSRVHVQKVLKRIDAISGGINSDNIEIYSLRKYKPSERVKLIETALYKHDNISFVVIDGVRDLISSINDEEQATEISTKLLKWTEELNCHISVVLHQNKNDNNARGHVGSELVNKAETTISVKSDKSDSSSIVSCEYSRGAEFKSFALFVDANGMPHTDEVAKKGKPTKPTAAERMTPDEIKAMMNVLFEGGNLSAGDLIDRLRAYITQNFAECHSRIPAIKEFKGYLENNGYIKNMKRTGRTSSYNINPKLLDTGKLL